MDHPVLRSPLPGWIGAWFVACTLCAAPTAAQDHHRRKPIVPSSQSARGPDAAAQDVGDVSVLVDNGLLATPRNLLDLDGRTVRFTPAGDHAYAVSSFGGALDPVYGPALDFGYPGTIYPGDDDTQAVSFPAGFPFFGTRYTTVWVNTDGNVTFGEPDIASTARDKERHALGAPRVSAFLHDWNPLDSFNPAGVGTIHAIVKSHPDRLVVTWNGVGDFETQGTSTFQLTLSSSGRVEIAFANLDPGSVYGVTGIAEGGGHGPFRCLDLGSEHQTYSAGALLEAFGLYTQVNVPLIAKEFYKTHPDQFDFLVVMTDFPVDAATGFFHSYFASNQTHGISTPLFDNGQPRYADTVYDQSADYGSAGELEQVILMNDCVNLFLSQPDWLANPPVLPYSPELNVFNAFAAFGGAVSLDGQPMTQVRLGGFLPPDDGELSRFFFHGGAFYPGTFSAMYALTHEIEHRWGTSLRFVHPTKGSGFDSYDLLGRQAEHWSFFFNSAVPDAQFPDGPRGASLDGNVIRDLGTPSEYRGSPTNLAPGEHVFVTDPAELSDGYCALDQYIMGLRHASEVGGFFYVDEPRSLATDASLDVLDPANVTNTSVTMRGWNPMGGIAFKGKRVDLTLQNVKDYEKAREGNRNPQGDRFWGPKGNLTVRYFSSTGHVDPAGDARVSLSTAERELGDEADLIDANGKPVDVKTTAFMLLVEDGTPSSHAGEISAADTLRSRWQQYVNGPASGGRAKFDTVLHPAIY